MSAVLLAVLWVVLVALALFVALAFVMALMVFLLREDGPLERVMDFFLVHVFRQDPS